MDRRIIFFLVMVGLTLVLEAYTYFGLKSLLTTQRQKSIFNWIYLSQFIFLGWCTYKIYQGSLTASPLRDSSSNFYIGLVFSSFVAKLIFSIGILLQDSGRLLFGSYNYIATLVSGNGDTSFIPERRNFITNFALVSAGIPFISMLYGITVGKYKYTVEKIRIAFGNLPKEFNGLKIVQISDIHSGSFDDKSAVLKGINMINALKPDLILFTGDLVNGQKEEIDPYIDIFGLLDARYGKYAILGNHDYYGLQTVPESEHEAYTKDFHSKYEEMGFKLLKNENTPIEINGEKIYLLGVENWGAGRFFQKYGDLDITLKGVEKDAFTILMSHDPTHWTEKVLDYDRVIPLTLSGHTHGMQFGVNFAGLKWSPAQYRYKHWSGLYQEKGQYLYVNRGFGFLGWPGRVGMWPEITLIELVNSEINQEKVS
jgi:uncharacterized protein